MPAETLESEPATKTPPSEMLASSTVTNGGRVSVTVASVIAMSPVLPTVTVYSIEPSGWTTPPEAGSAVLSRVGWNCTVSAGRPHAWPAASLLASPEYSATQV